jgi:predicted acyltransferase
LKVIGLNALTIYLVQELFDFKNVANIFAAGLSRHAGLYSSLVMAVAIVLSKWLFLYFLYRQKLFLKT